MNENRAANGDQPAPMSRCDDQKMDVRTGQGSTRLSREEFEIRYKAQFFDPAFDAVKAEVERVTELAWEVYDERRKSPRTRKAGEGFADPEQELSVEWLETRANIRTAQTEFERKDGASKVLLVCA